MLPAHSLRMSEEEQEYQKSTEGTGAGGGVDGGGRMNGLRGYTVEGARPLRIKEAATGKPRTQKQKGNGEECVQPAAAREAAIPEYGGLAKKCPP